MGYGTYYTTSNYVKQDLLLPVEEFARKAKSQMAGVTYVTSSSSYGTYVPAVAGQGSPPSTYGVYMSSTAPGVTFPSSYGTYVSSEASEESTYSSYVMSMEAEEDDDKHWENIVADNRELRAVYMREKDDPRHRMGDLLEACFAIYKRLKKEKRLGPAPKNFYPWLDGIPEWERVVMIRDNLAVMGITAQEMQWGKARGLSRSDFISQVNLKPSMVKAFIYGVAYLDKAGRKKYKLSFAPGGMVTMGTQPFDTGNYRTVFSGLGWAIWVLSPKGNFYAGNHIKGQFHHSSFLSGEPVKCGGEMVARAGRLLLLTAKSGHYHPEISNFAYAVKVLHDKGVDPKTFKVMVWESSGAPSPVAITGERFLQNPYTYEVWGQGKLDPKEWDPRHQG
ncbi:MAG: hypothetical protein JW821_15650 [Deltaproteobacteria bacterium]|nr:hypothetical protein [Deltaproteobacteria bacterium]